MLNIAVLEDHDALRELTLQVLREHGFQAWGAFDAEELDDILQAQSIDLLILDLNLPGENGLQVAKRLRPVMPRLYIIMTTARGDVRDRVSGYEHGADLYLPKPVSEDELLAAVNQFARRHADQHTESLRLLLDSNRLLLQGAQEVNLSRTETLILRALAEAPERRLPTFRLLEVSGKDMDSKAKSTLEVQIVNLRKKLARAGADGPAIRSIRNEGYELLLPVQLI